MTTAPTDTPPAAPQPTADFWAGPTRFAAIAAVVGLALYGIGGVLYMSMPVDPAHAKEYPTAVRQFLVSWLAGWTFWFSLPMGALALLMIHYLVKTSWGLLLRRPLEAASRTLPLLALLFLPIVIGAFLHHDQSAYWWSDVHSSGEAHDKEKKEAAAKDAADGPTPNDRITLKWEERMKAAQDQVDKAHHYEQESRRKGTFSFLSAPSMVGLFVVLFAIWGGMIYYLNKQGEISDAVIGQGTPEEQWVKVDGAREALNKFSGPGLILYALTITAAATQWTMSLEAGWASTMFPVIFAVNQFLTCFAFCLVVFLSISHREPFKSNLRPKFQIDMGSLMLAFTLFWSYTSFSQMMLIWIGNLPEEIPFYLKRSSTGWWAVSAGLIVFHFAVPFLLLLFRDIKMHPYRLRAMAGYLLVVCAVDVVWWVSPTYDHASPVFVMMDAGAVIGIGGVWGLVFLALLKKRPLLPVNELYYLPEGHSEHH
ncbi:MAG TPA: hypothetical protein VD866_08390 [Urbifossiella sp.]|nr:hypothetical protein [Urbifossiella sp.]